MTINKEKLEAAIKIIDEKLKGEAYAIRGTASLVLQGLDMNVDDIDILCDEKTALNANLKLSEYLVEKVVFKESPKFKSYYGKFLINGVNVEIMGDWQIFNNKKGWSKVYNADVVNITQIKVENLKIPVTKIELELEVFALMGRWTAYQKIKRLAGKSRQINSKSQNEKPQVASDQQKLF
ncbi:MAG: hypothetical protein WC988_03095 [Patescibacteria group bacterium]